MKISLMLRREPFGLTLERTLPGCFRERFQQEFEVKWYHPRSRFGNLRRDWEQVWLCMPRLNAIFVPDAQPAIFEHIHNEFSWSPKPWKRPWQYMFVKTATKKQFSPWLSQAAVGVSPAVPDADRFLVTGGSCKLRLMDFVSRQNLVYLKKGCSRRFIEREVQGRIRALNLNLHVPEIKSFSPDYTWFTEECLVGTPLERLADPAQKKKIFQESWRELQLLAAATEQEEETGEYVAGLVQSITAGIRQSSILAGHRKVELLARLRETCSLAEKLIPKHGPRLTTVISHGDFHPGNTMVRENRFWITDWEYSDRRQAGYDILVYTLRTRRPLGLTDRVRRFLTHMTNGQVTAWHNWPEMKNVTLPGMRLRLLILLLEEMQWHLEGSTNLLLFRIDRGFSYFLQELPRLLALLR